MLGLVRRDVPEDLPARERAALGFSLVGDALDVAGVAASALRCVAVASPGVLTDGRVAHFGGHGMPGWIGLDVGRLARDALGLPVIVEGDSALAALAERRIGAGRDSENFMYIYSGRRTGAAIISGGRLLRGAHGATGLIGELPELRWRELEAAAYGEGAATDVPEILGLGIAAMVLAVDPELVVVGGPSLDRLGSIIDDVQRHVARRCPVAPPVILGQFGADAVMRGAVWLALDAISAALAHAVAGQGILPRPTEVSALLG